MIQALKFNWTFRL